MTTLQMPLNHDADAVRMRVADWIARIQKLHSRLDTWVRGYPNATVTRGEIKQLMETPMKGHVAAQNVPTYTVIVDSKWRIAFVPSSLWIVGANGRINVVTNVQSHILVDLAGENGKPSDWQLVVDDVTKPLIRFDRTAFRNLLGERR